MNELLLELVGHVYPGNDAAQDALQERIMDGKGLAPAELMRAVGCKAGVALIQGGHLGAARS